MRTPRLALALPLALLGLTVVFFAGTQWSRRQPDAVCRALNKGIESILPADRAAAAKSGSCSHCHRSAHGAASRSRRSLLRAWWRDITISPMRDSLREGAFSSELVGGHKALGPDSCTLCHIKSGVAGSKARWNPSGTASFGDPGRTDVPSTTVCLSCHDGSLAGASASGPAGTRGQAPGSSHPVGMNYAAASAQHPEAYNPAEGSLGIRLEGGLVGCVSCHQLHGPADPRARPTIIETACESCHRR